MEGVRDNIHATALVLGDRGLLIAGTSGSGKTTLAVALVAGFLGRGRHAALVADDRVIVCVHAARLVATAPAPIAGLVEVRGRTPQPVAVQRRALIDLVVRLAPAAPRYAEPAAEEILGVLLPVLTLAERNATGAVAAIHSAINQPPFA